MAWFFGPFVHSLMNELKKIRLELGLNQRDMARIIGVKRSSLSMIELGDRPIPRLWRARLEDLKTEMLPLDAAESEITFRIELKTENLKNKLTLSCELLKVRCDKLTEALNQMRTDYEHALNLFALLCREMEAFVSSKRYSKDLQIRKEAARKTILATLPIRQQLLELEIEATRQKIVLMEELIHSYQHNA